MTYTYTPDGQVYSAKETGTNRTVDYVYSFDAKHRLISSEKKVNGTTVLRTRQLFNSNDQLTHENWKMDTKTYYRILTYNTGTDYSLNTVSMPTDELLTMGYDSLRRLLASRGNGVHGKFVVSLKQMRKRKFSARIPHQSKLPARYGREF